MVAAMQVIKSYETAVKEFSECAKRSSDELQMQNADRAVKNVRAIADKFNAELNTFKKRTSA